MDWAGAMRRSVLDSTRSIVIVGVLLIDAIIVIVVLIT